jgi:hypothetical protein
LGIATVSACSLVILEGMINVVAEKKDGVERGQVDGHHCYSENKLHAPVETIKLKGLPFKI